MGNIVHRHKIPVLKHVGRTFFLIKITVAVLLPSRKTGPSSFPQRIPSWMEMSSKKLKE
jgi:hypothetical protein